MKSIIQETKECFLCGRQTDLDLHHCIHGVANRKIADREGLTVYLCRDCHTGTNGVHNNREKDLYLIQTAQKAYEKEHSRSEWMALFSHNWLWDDE